MNGKNRIQRVLPKLKMFVLMPFKDELLEFYLSVKKHVEYMFNIDCKRADEIYWSSSSYFEKIIDSKDKTDIVLAICSGGNPNVMVEVGYSLGIGKQIIFITSDDPNDIPGDVRHYDFLFYDISNPRDFILDHLQRAIIDVCTQRLNIVRDSALEESV